MNEQETKGGDFTLKVLSSPELGGQFASWVVCRPEVIYKQLLTYSFTNFYSLRGWDGWWCHIFQV